ncbi:ABC transporter substrate-binding protein [Carnobacterium gallinarum]|uniref:ABC transporter substrate-binding protein n=1 Tax=Carnobacterium gallinarum TaxID=2749 RepID=UPI000554873A|nr:extracellular solute-binding protein [Carnobacterium gallinarum]
MKKSLIAMSLLTMSLVVFSACGKSESSANGAKSVDYQTAERVKDGELKVYAPKGKNTEWLESTLERYNKEYDTKLTLKTTDVAPPAITQKLTPLLVGNEILPELVIVQDSDITGVLDKFPDSFMNLTKAKFEDKYGKTIISSKLNGLKETAPNKDLFGIPQDLGMVMMFYREDLFKEAGVDIATVKDWDQLIDAGKKIKEKTGVDLVALDANGENSLISHIMQQQDKPLIDKDGNLNLATKEAKNAIKIVDKMIDAKIVSYYSSDKDRYPTFQKAAVIIEGTWLAGNMANNYPDDKDKWKVSQIVDYSADEQGLNPVSGGSAWYIGENAKNKTAAAQFMDFAISDEATQNDIIARGSASAVTKAYEGEAANTGFDFYGGQKIYEPILEAGNNAVSLAYYPYAGDAVNYLKMAVYDYWNGAKLEDSLAKQADLMAQKYSIEVNK